MLPFFIAAPVWSIEIFSFFSTIIRMQCLNGRTSSPPMHKQTKSLSVVFYLLVMLGLPCVMLLVMSVVSIATLHETMRESDSPMVGGAPFISVFLIFVLAWLSYAFLGAAVSHKRVSEGRPALPWWAAAWWFAVAMSLLSALVYVLGGVFFPAPEPECVGCLCCYDACLPSLP